MKRLWRLVTISACAAPALAVAQPLTGPYVNLGAGADFLQNEIFEPYDGYGPLKRSYIFDPGVAGEISIGYGLGNGLRVEIEGDYSNNRVRGVHLSVPERAGGNEQQFGGFLNAFYDFNLNLPVFPYLGVGVGYQELALNQINSSVSGAPIRSSTEYGGSFAYQGIAGLSYPLAAMPGLSLTAEYRMIGVVSPPPFDRGNGSGNTVSLGGVPLTSRSTVNNIFNHEALLGLRYAFNTAPPSSAPIEATAPPAPTAARTYLVFFDWDQLRFNGSVTADHRRGRPGIDPGADHADPGERIYRCLGHTAAYNQRLSVRRGETVAGELVRDGVPRAAITIHGFGESNPLVPTAPGVREPQHRRVEIILN